MALDTDQQMYQRVQRIAQRLIPQTTAFRPDAAQWKWEVNVEQTDDVNAYCMPGGKIMVYTGLIQKLNATDGELAAVIGHEIAHALREHSRERIHALMRSNSLWQGSPWRQGRARERWNSQPIVASHFSLPHSREQEAEADRIGLELMARAGYNPNDAVTLWNKMAKLGGGGPEFLSTHPSSESRMHDLEKNIPRVMPLYQAAAKP